VSSRPAERNAMNSGIMTTTGGMNCVASTPSDQARPPGKRKHYKA
jgi:hypothetical protein